MKNDLTHSDELLLQFNTARMFLAEEEEEEEEEEARIVVSLLDVTERKRAEDELQKSEKKYRDLVENALVGVYRTNLKGEILFVNDAMVKMLEYSSREEFMQSSALSRYKNPDNRKRLIETLRKEGSVNNFEIDILTKNGNAKTVLLSATLDGDVLSGMVRNITERKRAEEELHRRNQELSVLHAIDRAINETLDLDQILKVAIEKTMEFLDADTGIIYLLQEDSKTMLLMAHRGLSDEFVKNVETIQFGEGISGLAAAERKPVIVDIAHYPSKHLAPFIIKEGVQSLVSVPLLAKDRVLGAINIGSRKPDAFPENKIDTLHSIGIQIGAAIQNAELLIIEQRKTLQLSAINTISQNIAGFMDVEKLFSRVVKLIHETFGYAYVTLAVVDEKANEIIYKAAAGYNIAELKKSNEKLVPKGWIPREEGIIQWVALSGNPLLANDVSKEPRFLYCDVLKHSRSELTLPIMLRNKVAAVLDIQSDKLNAFNPDDLTTFETVVRDISVALENAQLYEELKISHTTYLGIINSLTEAIYIQDENGVFLEVNKTAEKFYGHPKEYFIGKTPELISAPGKNDIPIIAEAVKKAFNGEPQSFEFWGLRKNGTIFPKSVNLTSGEYFGKKVVIATARDITERKRAEEEIVSQKNRFAQLFENSPIAIVLLDDQDKVVHINESFSALFGYFLEEVKGQALNDIIVPPELKEEAKSYSDQTREGNQINKESYRKRKDGTLVYVQIVGVPVTVNDKTVGIYGMYVDLTQRKDAEDKIKSAKELAEQSDKMKTEFLAQMSHEIRTPINIMLGNVDYLKDLFDKKTDSDTRDCFDGIDLASKRIIRTIDLILNVAELQTSGYKSQFVKVDLKSEVLNKLYQEHQLSAKQKGLEFIYTCKEKDLNVIADEYSITQIFANLIDNAIKYTKKGKVEILLEKNKAGNIMVEVKDTGIGISKEFLPRLFEPFVQEDQGYTRSYDGSGLGLVLVKRYCDINNAVIEVESEKGVGTTFRVIFK